MNNGESIIKNVEIIIPRTAEFHSKAQELSDYIQKLGLNYEQNDTLVRLMQEMTETAEKSGFAGGISFCMSVEGEGSTECP